MKTIIPHTLSQAAICAALVAASTSLVTALPHGPLERSSTSHGFEDPSVDSAAVAEIDAASEDGLPFIYADDEQGALRFVNTADPLSPQPAGHLLLRGEPTSVAVRDGLALGPVSPCADFVNASGDLLELDGAVPEGLASGDWASIRAAYEAGRHAFFATEDGHRARSHGNAWGGEFDGEGVSLRPDAGDWSFGLELERYGFESALTLVDQAAEVRADGQHLTYDWDASLSEWWKNDTRGLEHGFTIHRRPKYLGEVGAGPLVFDLAVRGDLRPATMASGRGLRLTNAAGATALTYDGLVAFDADGTQLETWLEASKSGIRIAVLEEGARYPLTVDPVMQTAYLKASNTAQFDEFGGAVAVSGNTVVVGALGEFSSATGVNGDQSDNSAPDSGAAYVFVRTGSTWSQQAYLKASNTDASDFFGLSVALSGDTLVVGATLEDSSATGVNGNQSDNSALNSGAAYVFVRTGTTWSQQAYLKASNTDRLDQFGVSVAVSGETVVVGSIEDDSSATGVNGDQFNSGADGSGAAYVFVRTGSTWSQQAYLKASNTDAFDSFGLTVDVSGDTVVVGAVGEDSSAIGVNGDQSDNSAGGAGAAYVFVRTAGVWSQQAYLKASNSDANDVFAGSVAVSGDTVVVGASGESSSATGVNGDQSDNTMIRAGAVYVFARTGSTWSQQAYLKASNAAGSDRFGQSVAVAGNTVVVGAILEDSSATGVNGDQSDNSANSAGAAYVFVRTGSTWIQQAYLKASNAAGSDRFGQSVAVSGNTVAVGATSEDSSATGVNGDQLDNSAPVSGAVYLFDLAALDTIGSAICQPALANSTGASGVLVASGSDVAADNNLTFTASGLPPASLGLLVNSRNVMAAPFSPLGDGLLCIGPGYGRHISTFAMSDMAGVLSNTVNLTALPRPSPPFEPALTGQTWYFQLWHSDGGSATGSNLTNALEIVFR